MNLAAALRLHALGMLAVFVGAWLTSAGESMLPLALGSALALMTCSNLVGALWRGKGAPRGPAP